VEELGGRAWRLRDRRTACLECGLEQAVADAGTCERCSAPLPGAGHPAGTFTFPGGAELRLDSSGISVRSRLTAPARLLAWEEIGWFRDGWHAPGSERPGWALHVVLAGGRVEQATETWTAGGTQAPPEILALIRRAAAAHSIPAVLTGGRVHDGLPGKDAGLYYDPAGEPGLREWTGTEWSSFLQVDPSGSGQPGQEKGLATIWSPVPAAELDRQSRAVLRGVRIGTTFMVVLVGGPGLFFMLGAALNASSLAGPSRSLGLAAYLAALGVFFLIAMVAGVRQFRPERRIALALRAAAIRVSREDDPSAAASPPGTPEDREEID
jgi:hypothetical protein